MHLELAMDGGSRVSGDLKDPGLRIETGVGKVRLARAEQLRKDGGSLVIGWANGDLLHVAEGAGPIELVTLVGALKVPVDRIERAEIELIERPPPIAPAAVRVSGQYAHHKTELAFDGEIGQGWSSGAWGGWIEFDLGQVYALERIVTHLQFHPQGPAVHDVYVSDKPIGTAREGARRLQRFGGQRKNNDVLAVECGPNVSGRYVQVHCPSSRSWFNVRELEVFARE